MKIQTKILPKPITVQLRRVLTVSNNEQETVIHLGNGDQLVGKLERDTFSVSTLTGELDVPIRHLHQISVLRPTLDLTEVSPTQIILVDTAYFSRNQLVHRGIAKPIDGGKEATRYLYTHAPTKVSYRLDPQFRFFRAKGYLGTNHGKVQFKVVVDGKTLFESQELSKRSHIDIAVELPEGSKALQLVVDDLGFKNNDHAFWLSPRLEK